jgi:hypothetical protein
LNADDVPGVEATQAYLDAFRRRPRPSPDVIAEFGRAWRAELLATGCTPPAPKLGEVAR